MDVFPKFIIETDDELGDCLIIAKCTYHKQLATFTEKVKGGGWWTYDFDNKIFTLYGRSEDFGKAKIEDIKNCILNNNVYDSTLLDSKLDDCTFKYKTESGEIIDL